MPSPDSPLRAFLRGFGGRRIVAVAIAYLVLAAGAIGLAADVEEGLSLPGWTDTLVIVVALAGLPVALLVGWVFDLDIPAATRGRSAERDRPARAGGSQKSVVVVPFDSVGAAAEQEYFSDGLTDEIITDLSMVEALRVIARGSSMKLKDRKLEYDELAALLDVGYAVEGSVRKAGNALRVSAHLVDLSTGSVLWGDRYEGSLSDVFEIQESVAGSVVKALRVELSPREEARLRSRPVPDAVAYDEYLRARPGIYAMNAEALDRAEGHLRRALEICPDSPLLLKGLGLVLYQRYNTGVDSDPVLLDEVVAYSDRIETLDPDGGDAELLRGLLTEYMGPDVQQAVRHLRRAYAADPENVDARFWLCISSMSTGQLELSARLAEELVRVDPLAPLTHLFVAYAAYFDGRPGERVPALGRAMELGEDVPPVWWAATRILIAAGDLDAAHEAVEHLQDQHAETPFRASSEGLLLAMEGDRDRSLALLSDEVRNWAWKASEWAQAVGDWCAEAGAQEEALRWLERSRQNGFINHRFVAEHDPHLEPLRGRADFRRYLERVRTDLEEFEAGLEPVSG